MGFQTSTIPSQPMVSQVTPSYPSEQVAQPSNANPRVVPLIMNCDGLVYYDSNPTESIKNVMKHFLEIQLKRPVTKDDLKQYSLVRLSQPDLPLSKKKTIEECGITEYTMLECGFN